MGSQSGFTLIESILSLMIASIVITLCLNGFTFLHISKKMPKSNIDKEIMYKQLQDELLVSSNITTDGSQLFYTKDETEFRLMIDGTRLVKKEGYEIFLYDIEAVSFEINDFITMTTLHNGEELCRIIGIHRLTYD